MRHYFERHKSNTHRSRLWVPSHAAESDLQRILLVNKPKPFERSRNGLERDHLKGVPAGYHATVGYFRYSLQNNRHVLRAMLQLFLCCFALVLTHAQTYSLCSEKMDVHRYNILEYTKNVAQR